MFGRPGSGRLGRLSQVLRPMMTGAPMVVRLKWARSSFRRQGNCPAAPITLFRPWATMRLRRMGSIMGVVPCCLATDKLGAVPGAVNSECVNWGVLHPVSSPGQGDCAAIAAFANTEGAEDG